MYYFEVIFIHEDNLNVIIPAKNYDEFQIKLDKLFYRMRGNTILEYVVNELDLHKDTKELEKILINAQNKMDQYFENFKK